MSYLRNNKPKYFDDGPSAMADSRAMDDSSQILQLFQKTNKRILRLFDAKQNDANDEDENNTFGIEVLNKSESESETDVDNDKENGDIEIAETQSQEADITPPHNNNPQNRRNGIKSLNIKNLSPIDICTISSEGSKSRITPSVDCFKEPTPRSPIHKKPAIPKPNTSLRRSVFKPNIVSDFENFYCSTPRTGELPHTFQDSMRMSPIRNCSVSTNQEDNLPQLRIRSVAEIHKSILNNGSNNNVAIQTRRNSVNDPSPANIHPKKSLDFAMRRTSVDSTTTKKSKPTSIGSIEPELLQQYEKYVLKTPTKTPMSRTSRSSKSPVSHRSNRLQQISNMDIDSEIFCETVSSKRKSINQTDYRPMNMAETPVQSNNIAQNRESMLVMKNKLAMCETADEDMDVEQTSDEDEGMQVEVVEEPVCNIRSKRPGTPSRIPLPFSQHDPKKKRIVLEKITSNSDNDIANNLSPSLLLSFRNLPTKRRSNEKATDANEITSSQLEEQMSLALPKKKRKKSKEIDSVRKEYGGLVDELRKKNKLRSKVVGPEVRKRTLYSRDSPETSRCLRSSIRENKSVSDIELEVMMNEIHGITPLVTNDKNNAEKEVEEQSETSDNNTEAEVVKETIEDILVTKSKVTQNSKYSTIADKLEHQANVEKPQTSSKINARPKPLSKKKFSRVIVQDNVEKPQTRKTKFSRIIVQDDSDDNDNYSLLDEIEERSQVVGSVVSKRKSLNKQKVTRTEEMAVADEFVFKKPDVPTKKLSKRQKFLQKELEGLKIRFDRNLMNSDSDEGIEISDTDLYRVPECERKLRVRHLYSRPYWMQGQHQFGIRYSTLNPMEELKKKNFEKEQRAMHTGGNRVQSMIESCLNLTDRVQLIEEHQVNERNNRDKRSRSKSKEPSTVVTQKAASRKQKSKKQFNESVSTDYGGYSSSTHQCVTSTNQMSTIHEQSDSCSSTTIPEEAAAFANLLSRFGAHRKDDNGSITSESSTRVHSEYFDCAQMEDLNFIEVSEGILFGKYIDSMGCGVIQFKEGKKRDRAKTKKSNIKLFMLCGLLELTVGKKIHILKPMGFMFIRCGISYEMRNIYSGVSMVVFIREDEHVSINSEITSSSSNNKTQK
ncbi:unnamed protein product [Diamesa serratosioi]